jgi:NAD(P)H dehydrogenase (quinone)
VDALIVVAHPERESYTAALARTAAETLAADGWNVVFDDLAAEGFRPDAGWHDVLEEPCGPLQVMAAQARATAGGGFAPDVAREIARLRACDLLITAFPLWWFGPPALLKGWFDRVLAYGVGYSDRPFTEGPLQGKRALAIVTTAGDEAGYYGPEGRAGDLRALLNPVLHGTFAYCAFDVLDPLVVYEADGPDDAVRTRGLAEVRTRLAGIGTEAPIVTRPLRAQ